MKTVAIAFLCLISYQLSASNNELERINFFPKSKAFLITSYMYEVLEIETPQSTINTKEVSNYYNRMNVVYGQKVTNSIFGGILLSFLESSENGVRYGLPINRRFSSTGFREPELFVIYRLFPQKDKQGLVDLNLSFTPKLGDREVGHTNSNALNGRNILSGTISHGYLEDKWEFKSQLGYTYYDEGEEENSFTNKMYDLEPFGTFSFRFLAQYEVSPWLYIFGGIGVIYQTTQDVRERGGDKRELQVGTGSLYKLGLKKPLSKESLLQFSWDVKRNDYFVKGVSNNLEGIEFYQSFSLDIIFAL
jgi:hypothetical protein